MRLFVARHGQTQWNVENKICGRTDVPLTAVGMEQARLLAENAKGIALDLIIASPLLRARQTAAAVAEACGVEVQLDERLMEQDYGIYEGEDRFNPGFLANKRCFACRYPGGESMMQLAARVYAVIEDVKRLHGDKNVLLVCHNGICRVIHSYFCDVTNEEFAEFSIENAAIREYEL
jgi:probable phosphoglycerate mutase